MSLPDASASETMQAFERFRAQAVLDPALMEKLCAPNSIEACSALFVAVGAERGFRFTGEDVQAGLLSARRAWFERWVA